MSRIRIVAILGVFLITTLGPAIAGGTGALVVQCKFKKDNSSAIGVTVAVENKAGLLAKVEGKVTDAAGKATFMLPAGSGYVTTVTLVGYNTYVSDEFKIELDKTKTLLFSMQEQLTEKVIVRGGRPVDLDEGAENTVTFSDQFIEDLPVLGHSYQNVLTLAPGVNDSDGDGNPNVHGARERDFKATVDGVSNVDPLTGTFMSNINPDAIEEIEVVTTGAGAEYGRAVGGFGKIITKQGGNTFETVASVYLRHSALDGDTNQVEGSEEVDYHDVRPALNITGPVVKDKLFFALFHEYRDVERPVNLLSGGTIIDRTEGSLNTDKLTWQTSPRNKLIFQAQADPIRRGPRGIDNLTDPQSGYDYKQGGPTYQLRWNAQASSVLNVESLIASSHTGIDLIPITNGVKNGCAVDALGSARLDPFGGPGGEPLDEDYCFETRTSRRSGSYFFGHTDDRIRYTLKSDATYFLEDFLGVSHTLKGGVIAEKERYEATETLRSFSVFDEAAPAAQLDQENTSGGGTYLRTVYQPGLPTSDTNKADGVTYGFYLEDQFRPHPNVSIRMGVRVERETVEADGFKFFDPEEEGKTYDEKFAACVGPNPTPGQLGDCARANFKEFHRYEKWPTSGTSLLEAYATNPAINTQPREPETFRISNTNIGPRFSVSWDPKGDQKTKLFLSAGRVYDKIFLAVPIGEQGPDSFQYRYRVDAVAGSTCFPDPNGNGTICPTSKVINQVDEQAIVSPATVYQVDRNLKTPHVDEYTFGFSREIAPETSITLTYIKRRYKDLLQDIDANHYGRDLGTVKTSGCYRPSPTTAYQPIDETPDGIFDDCGGRLISVPGPPPNYQTRTVEVPDDVPDLFIWNPMFNRVFRVGNYNEADYKAYQIELTRRLHRNWQLEGSYIWSKAVGNAEDFASALGDDPTNTNDEYGYLDYDQRHFLRVNVTTQIPLWNVRLGSSFQWATGLPYSRIETYISPDQPRSIGPSSVSYDQSRTVYPTNQRNDERNEAYWVFNVSGKKDFTVGKANLETSLEIFNLLDNDYLVATGVTNGRTTAFRAIGRQFQLGAKVSF